MPGRWLYATVPLRSLSTRGAELRRDDYRALDGSGLLHQGPERLHEIEDHVLLDLLGNDRRRLDTLRTAIVALETAKNVPQLDDLLPPDTD